MSTPLYPGALKSWSLRHKRPAPPFLCTTLNRGDEIFDVTVEFEVEHGQFWVLDAYLDAPEPGDSLTNDECLQLSEWLSADGYDRALDAALNH